MSRRAAITRAISYGMIYNISLLHLQIQRPMVRHAECDEETRNINHVEKHKTISNNGRQVSRDVVPKFQRGECMIPYVDASTYVQVLSSQNVSILI